MAVRVLTEGLYTISGLVDWTGMDWNGMDWNGMD